jgi:aspartyl-tRNA(Asn)/glutamyl-tRNA(Gln) amidotransferase subunit B
MAIKSEIREQYTPTIGIECHVQLKTKTKLFSAVGNDARQATPNSLISHIDVGLPGALPVLNEAALELAVRVAFALNTEPQKFSKFDRKHYFYPDLPKGYQITQYENPIIIGGFVEINSGEQPKQINITRVHLEEDAGKNIHPAGSDYSLVDLNRAGTPLLEIVSEPQINSAAEAKAYARELYLLMKYADVSDVDLYHGNMRFDVNISVSKQSGKLGNRAEIKNLNSFRSVENAVTYEINRQIELLENGQPVVQETRGWDEAKQKTTSQRGKEEAHDYRYMPEPDIPPIELDDDFVEKIKSKLPRLPGEWREILNKLSISKDSIETLLDAQSGSTENYLDMIELAAVDTEFGRFVTNAIINTVIPLEQELGVKLAQVDHARVYKEIYALFKNGMLSSNNVNELLKKSFNPTHTKNLSQSREEVAKELGLIQVSDQAEIEKIVSEVLAENQKAAEDVKNGEAKAIGFLVGQVMAKSQGKANPQVAQKIIKQQLGL